MAEQWRAVADFPGYEVSDLGRVRRDGRLRVLQVNHVGYLVLNLWCEGSESPKRVARLVARAFVPNPDQKPR